MLSNFKWAFLEQIGVQLISFTVFMVLARLLGPEAFGVLALSQMLIMLVGHTVQQGFGQAIIQNTSLEKAHTHSAFWALVAQSLIGFLLLNAFAFELARLFDADELESVICALSFIFLITPVYTIQQALAKRELKFKRLAFQMVVATIVSNATALILALAGAGIWSLVAREILQVLINAVLLWRFSEWRPSLKFSMSHLRDLWGYSWNVIIGNLVLFGNTQMPGALIGYFLGTAELGVFHVAMRIVNLLNQLLARTIEKVAMPLFSRMQDHRDQLLSMYYKLTNGMAIIVFPVFVGLILIAEEFIVLMIGEAWLNSIEPLKILLLMGVAQCLTYLSIAMLMGIGQPKVRTKILTIEGLVKVLLMLVVIDSGVSAVSVAIVVAVYMAFPLWVLAIRRHLDLGIGDYLVQYIPSVMAAVTMVVAVYVGDSFLLQALPEINRYLSLMAKVMLGGIVYSAIIWFLFQDSLITLKEMFVEDSQR